MHNAIEIGKISSIDYENGCADVLFSGMDNNIRVALPFLSNEYDMPSIGDMVLVAFQNYSDTRKQGFIIGKYYNSSNMPPAGLSVGDYFKKFSDNVFIKYSAKENAFLLSAGGISINADINNETITLSGKKVDIIGETITLSGKKVDIIEE